MKKIFTSSVSVLLAVNFTSLQTHSASNVKMPLAPMACEESPLYPAKFKIIENNGEKIQIEIGNFDSLQAIGANTEYNYEVSFNSELIQSGKVKTSSIVLVDLLSLKNKFPKIGTGAYLFTFKNGSNPVWQQNVYSVSKGDSVTEGVLTSEELDEYAKAFAPVLSMYQGIDPKTKKIIDEEYHPVSIEYLMNLESPNPSLDEEMVSLVNKTNMKFEIKAPFKDVRNLLPFYGEKNSYFQILSPIDKSLFRKRFGKGSETVYYSILQKNSKGEKLVYINYHFLYVFDPKTGSSEKPAIAAHVYDRESITVVFKVSEAKTLRPMHVIYGAHLPNQTMALLNKNTGFFSRSDEKLYQKWQGGRVLVPWGQVIKMGSHPLTVAAQGSHGMYPVLGTYLVMATDARDMLEEPSGSRNHILYPDQIMAPRFATKVKTHTPYQLKKLQIENLTTNCNNPQRYLVYSGALVHNLVLDVANLVSATYPPFTDREIDFASYADANSYTFLFKDDEGNFKVDPRMLRESQQIMNVEKWKKLPEIKLKALAPPLKYAPK